MKQIIVVALVTIALFFARPALAQQPAPTDAPQTAESKPWNRLLIFVPGSVVIGAGTVFVRRRLRERGWSPE